MGGDMKDGEYSGGDARAHAEAERIVGNAFYMNHPFKFGGAGLAEFFELVGMIEQIDPLFLKEQIVLELDRLLEHEKKCHSCYMKCCWLSVLLCRDLLPEDANRYEGLYEKMAPYHLGRTRRDYRGEVEDALSRYREKLGSA